MSRLIHLILFLSLLLSACGPAVSPTPVDELTPIHLPTHTPTPTLPLALTATPPPALAAPQLLSRQPASSRIVERQPVITLKFDRAMSAESMARALTVEPRLPISVTSLGGLTLTVSMLAPLTPGGLYTFTLGANATDMQGVALDQEYVWTYSPKPFAPSLTPPSKFLGRRPFKLWFTYPVNPASLEQAMRITPALSGTLGWNDQHTLATFTPTIEYATDTLYVIHFDRVPVLDANDDVLPMPAPITFTTPSSILAFYPEEDTGHANPAAPIQITFDRPMNHVSAEAAFVISPTIPGRFEWDDTSLRFLPESGYLDEFTQYTVSLQPTATDAGGAVVLKRAQTWSFRTGALPDAVSFGYGPNAQAIDAEGQRALQFSLLQKVSSVTFEVYRLSTTQLLNRYASDFQSRQEYDGQDETIISTTGLALAGQWQTDVSEAEPQKYGAVPIETLLPADLPPGAYVLNLKVGQRLNDQLLVLLSRHALAVKKTGDEVVAWVTDVNGQPAPDVDVNVYAPGGVSLGACRTSVEGLCRVSFGPTSVPMLVIAQSGDDLAATGLTGHWQSAYANGGSLPTDLIHIHTDRPIYQPGQTVYFKASVRHDDDALLSLPPAGTTLTVRLRDARNNTVRTIYLATNEFGTASSLFRIAEGAMLGDYAVEVALDSVTQRQAFKVQDYRKPDYAVTVATDSNRYVAGDAIHVSVDTRYFFGEPVPNARLTIKQYEFGTGYTCDEWRCTAHDTWIGSYDPDRTGRTDANGHFTFTVEARLGYQTEQLDWWSDIQQSRWGIEVTVDDGSHQTVSAFAPVTVLNTEEFLRLDPGGYFKTPGETFEVTARVRSIFDQPVERALSLQVRRWNSKTYDYTTLVQSASLTTDANGEGRYPLTVAEAGYYQLRLSGRDRRGNSIETVNWLYVFDDSARWSHDGNRGDLSISADRETYAPGDTAALLIESTMSGPALLTVERGTVRREQLINLTAPLTRVSLALQPDDSPNVFVSVMAWKEPAKFDKTQDLPDYYYLSSVADSQLRVAHTQLSVPPTDKQLTLTLTADKDAYAPREQATFTITVKDALGQPASAEVSLALVDEAIFSLSQDLSKPLYEAFYFERAHGVDTYDSFRPSRIIGWNDSCFGGCRGGGGDGSGLLGNPRSNFPDTALWEPEIRTDANGVAVVSLVLPDSLTSWRLTVKAITTDTRVGEASTNILTQQEIVVRPLLPDTLTLSDTVALSAIVHNYGASARTLTAQINARGLHVMDAATQTLTLAPGEQGLVGWTAIATEIGEATITVSAFDSEAADAVKLSLPIQPLAVPDVTSKIGEFTGEFSTILVAPSDALSNSTVKIELSRSIAGSLLTGLEYLTGYPYGCVEQTMSKALPNAVVARAFHQLGVGDPGVLADLRPKIDASVQRLYGFQHNDGGWGWWHDDATDDYQTAWVVFGLSATKEAGYEIDSGVIERGAAYLASRLDQMDVRTRAFALYAMAKAGYGDLSASERLAQQAGEKLDPFSQAALALALHHLGADANARNLLDILARTAVVKNGQVSWPSATEDGHYHAKTMSSTTRNTALALSAFVAIAPEHELETGIVRWLMSQRRPQGWGSTNETSFTILALTDHLRAHESGTANTDYGVELNGAVIANGTLGQGAPNTTLEISVAQLKTGLNRLRLTQAGGGQLYYVVQSRMYEPQVSIESQGSLQVSRTYLNADTGRPLTTTLRVGQLVRVQLSLTLPQTGFYMLVEDKLPGGLEALNESLNTASHDGLAYTNCYDYTNCEGQRWQTLGYNNKEVRGDRVSFFITELTKGRHTFTYVARATRSGTFVALPAEASAMYDLTLWGRSSSAEVVIAE